MRYAGVHDDVYAVAASAQKALESGAAAQRLLDWHSIYDGLCAIDPLLRDASFGLFAHLRSSMWMGNTGKGGLQYRQWESLEFTDLMNPTNGCVS